MIQKKLKVLWYCYFTNSEMQDILNPYKRIGEFAPWITKMIPLFENDEDVELHVVSSHEWISGYKHFKKKGVSFHFFNKDIPFLGRHWPGFFRFDIWSDYFVIKQRIANLVKKIRPDIIHMHGFENPFCTGITQFQGKYPVFITIQGFLHKSLSKVPKKRVNKELEIIKMFNHYGYRTQTMGEDIKALNPNVVLHWHQYPGMFIDRIKVKKKFDLVFFARMSKDKGFVDLLKAVSIIKKQKQDISLCAIGGGKSEYLKSLAIELDIEKNISWAGFLQTQEEVHKLASTAKVSVLPTYYDMIPGTIIESMFLKLPVIAYNAGSIHEVNKHKDIISLVPIGDVTMLANAIIILLADEDEQKNRAELGYQQAMEMFNTANVDIRSDLLKAYMEVIEDFKLQRS